MISMSVNHDLRTLRIQIEKAPAEIRDKAAVRALNRTGTTIRAQASREISQVYNLRATVAKAQIEVVQATRARLRMEVVAKGSPIPLYKFDARKRSGGLITVQVKRAGGRRVVKGKPDLVGAPFVAKMKSGHIGIFQRLTNRRLPIRELTSLGVPGALTGKLVFEAVERVAMDTFERNFDREVAYLLSKG